MSDDGFYSKKELRAVVILSMTQVDRLERAKQFPPRVILGNAKNSRVGWVKKEVLAWCLARMAERHSQPE
jgi:predicted DNA-binding transcriptional regulator AlpA